MSSRANYNTLWVLSHVGVPSATRPQSITHHKMLVILLNIPCIHWNYIRHFKY